MNRSVIMVALASWLVAICVSASSGQQFEGVGACGKCHPAQAQSWMQTAHAQALESLKPNIKAAAKTRAGLDPVKDYTSEAGCLLCHTTGYGKPGGYTIGMQPAQSKDLAAVGCESCHGAGSVFRQAHADAEFRLRTMAEQTDRDVLVKSGQNFDYEAACGFCHLSSPFNASIDPKYRFDYRSEVLKPDKGTGVHEHFKLKGVFTGEPIPDIRADTQKNAKESD
jgi:hypothetical protein